MPYTPGKGKATLFAVLGQRFGRGVVTDPEMRAGFSPSKPGGYRYARLRCDCGTEYLAQLTHLYSGRSRACPGCARREQGRKRRRLGGRVFPHGPSRGYTVTVYVGWYKSREEAEAVARRARAMVLPESHFTTAGTLT